MARRIQSAWVPGPAGRLEALLEEPDEVAAREVCLVCHPHPLFGGTMHNKVVYRLARGLRRSGSVVLRFNFRGVGGSQGEHAHGVGEVEDARACLDWLRARYPDLPFSVAGFSFGARVTLKLCEAGRPRRLIALGLPSRGADTSHLETCSAPKILIQSTHDEFGPRAETEILFGRFREPKRLIWVEAGDHFFRGALERLEEVVRTL
ncbi:MAG: alpha/beta hydrolase [Bryobacterales bacterium]|nr:alpha/beta hydrolase [Bryobacterales bacterium]